MKTLILISTILIGQLAIAKVKVCKPCEDAIKLESTIADSKIAPDQFNSATINKQNEFIAQSASIINQILNDRDFNQASAHATLKLLSRVACFYDNTSLVVGTNGAKFKSLYKQKNSFLQEHMNILVKSGEISEKRKWAILEFIGAIESKDRIDAGCADYK